MRGEELAVAFPFPKSRARTDRARRVRAASRICRDHLRHLPVRDAGRPLPPLVFSRKLSKRRDGGDRSCRRRDALRRANFPAPTFSNSLTCRIAPSFSAIRRAGGVSPSIARGSVPHSLVRWRSVSLRRAVLGSDRSSRAARFRGQGRHSANRSRRRANRWFHDPGTARPLISLLPVRFGGRRPRRTAGLTRIRGAGANRSGVRSLERPLPSRLARRRSFGHWHELKSTKQRRQSRSLH